MHTHTFIAAFDGIAVFWHSELVLFPVLPAAYVCNLVYVCLQREFPSVTCFHSSASVGGFVSGTVWRRCFLSLSLNFLINSSLFFSYSLISSFQNNLFLSLRLAVSIVHALRSNLSPALVSVQGKLSPRFSNTHHNAVYQTHCKNAKSHTAPHITFKHLFLHTNMTFTIPISVSHFQSCSRQKPFADFFFCVCVCVHARLCGSLPTSKDTTAIKLN